ncbi:MAG: YggS family pyridoxal phosphate-dependent enzyme [Candidatus Omnitrophota bacterium]|nr:YggS family pyridoxal phosphate-dependent enzyme [Candidatus Omnitrophota bacterium]
MIEDNLRKILAELPPGIELVVAAKARIALEIERAISAGAKIIGENYVKEAQEKISVIGSKAKWHLFGHLQKNKAKLAVKIFDMIETLDSEELAEALDKECKKINKIMPVLIEVNSASEVQKAGVLPDRVEYFVKEILRFENLKLQGLMTMGPLVDNPEEIRPFFRKTKEIFDKIKNIYGNSLDWKYLSMGMSDTYKIAIEEGANMVRIGTAIFGKRE